MCLGEKGIKASLSEGTAHRKALRCKRLWHIAGDEEGMMGRDGEKSGDVGMSQTELRPVTLKAMRTC